MATFYHIDNSSISQGFGNSSFNYGKFGITRNGGYFHDGVDVAGPSGTPVLAHEDGNRLAGYEAGGYGNYVVFSARGWEVFYGHLRDPAKNGPVKRGGIIGIRGSTGNSTGPHTHISTYPPNRNRSNGVRGAVDPNEYFGGTIVENMPYTDAQYNEMNRYAVNGIFQQFLNRPANEEDLKIWVGQGLSKVIDGIFSPSAPEYKETLRREIHKRTGEYPTDTLLEENRKARTPVKDLLLQYMTDRYGEKGSTDADKKLAQIKELLK